MAEAGQRPFPGWDPGDDRDEERAEERGSGSGPEAERRWRDIVREEERRQEEAPQPGASGSEAARESPRSIDVAREVAQLRRGRGERTGREFGSDGSTDRARGAGPWVGGGLDDDIERLRREARRAARQDAEAGVPDRDAPEPSTPESERSLRERCRALFERWKNRELTRYREVLASAEERVSERLTEAGLAIDRYERLTSELRRLKIRMAMRRDEVKRE
ncbi:MAG: hypothetical protein R3266_15110, partial [Gemmatimonadota bacterium]|nr:hypothetical protein [Gemmatimonadota bacterium]